MKININMELQKFADTTKIRSLCMKGRLSQTFLPSPELRKRVVTTIKAGIYAKQT